MYEELVETLRETADKRMHEAADAIEELEKDLERSKEYETFWNKEAEEALRRFQVAVANKPRWIPVAERLPEDFENVLIVFQNGDMAVGFKMTVKTEETNLLLWRTMTEEDFCSDCDTPPTHWMPLPEPPKEET